MLFFQFSPDCTSKHGKIVAMTNVVETLKETGLSYDIIGVVCGEQYSTICNYAAGAKNLPESAVDKLKRLESALDKAEKENTADIFEKHILANEYQEGGAAWVYLYELWANGIISDEELTSKIDNIDVILDMAGLAEKFIGETQISVESGDILWHAEPYELLAFREQFQELEAV